jgi:predicted nucleic acid-binding Zn ribbon protein
MKVFWDVQCSRCDGIFEDFVEREQPSAYTGECPTCGPEVALERVYVHAPGLSFGGISGAVQGSGFYSTDYKTKESDLVPRRAEEHARKMGLDPGGNRNRKKTGS